MHKQLSIAGVVVLSLALGCAPAAERAQAPAPAEEPMAEVAATGDALLDQFMQAWDNAFNSGDSAQTVALYADGATMMPPDAPAMDGKDAIGDFVGQFHALGKVAVKDAWAGYHMSDDTIGAHGTWTLDIAPAEGEVIQDSGRWIAIWKRRADGSWEMSRNIWNSDRLAEGMAEPPGYGAGVADEIPEPAEPVCPADLSALDAAFASTFEAGDLGGNVATHGENAVRHPPNVPSVSGRAAMTAFIGAYMDAFDPRQLAVNTTDSYEAGDWGVVWGTYSFNYTLTDGGGAIEGGGKYMGTATKGDDGCWRSEWVLWNSDAPPA